MLHSRSDEHGPVYRGAGMGADRMIESQAPQSERAPFSSSHPNWETISDVLTDGLSVLGAHFFTWIHSSKSGEICHVNSKGSSCKTHSLVLVLPPEKHKQVFVASSTPPLHSKHLNISPSVPQMIWFLNPHLPLLRTLLCERLPKIWHQDWNALLQLQVV